MIERFVNNHYTSAAAFCTGKADSSANSMYIHTPNDTDGIFLHLIYIHPETRAAEAEGERDGKGFQVK